MRYFLFFFENKFEKRKITQILSHNMDLNYVQNLTIA